MDMPRTHASEPKARAVPLIPALQVKRLAAHYGITQTLAQASTLGDATPKILREISETLGWEIGVHWGVDVKSQMMICEEIYSSPTLKAEKFIAKIRKTQFPKAQGSPGRVWASGKLEWTGDYNDDDFPRTPGQTKNETSSATAAGAGGQGKKETLGAACIPIELNGQIVGAMEFLSRDIRKPDKTVLEMLTLIATQLGLFIERIRAKEALQESEERYSALADTSPDVLITIDHDMEIVFINTAVESVFGFAQAEVLGKNLTLLIPEFPNHKHALLSGVKPGPAKRLELSGLHKNGNALPLEITFSALRGKGKGYATGIVHDISERKRTLEALRETELKLKSVLASTPAAQIVAEAPAMLSLLKRVKKAAASDAVLLIEGETGSGKECIALMLHQQSSRAGKAFVARNCAAIPKEVFESEMFGHKKGSFTGADRDRKGAFLEADGGTLFLDEIGDLDYSLQTKLLRAIQERVIQPVGSDREVAVNARVISATNKDLRECIEKHEFREDLYYRLATVVLTVPPLRERREDIIPLARHFIGLASKWSRSLTPEAEERLRAYSWPGNVRELRSLMEQAVIFAMGNEILADELNFPVMTGNEEATSHSLSSIEQRHILQVLKDCKGNKTDAAKLLGLARSTLVLKVQGFAKAESSNQNASTDE